MSNLKENPWERDHWFDPKESVTRVDDGVIVKKPSLPEDVSATIRGMIHQSLIEAAWGKLKGPGNLFEAAELLVRRVKRPISIGSVGCGRAEKEKELARSRWISSVRACEVDYSRDTDYRREEDNIAVFGIAGMGTEQVSRKILSVVGDVDLLFFGDSLHHAPDPYVYLKEAIQHAKKWILVSEPFHMDYDGVTPQTGYLMDSTPFLDSMLSESRHRIWINWAILKGWKVAYIRLIPFPDSSVMDDELERTFVVLEKPQDGEKPPYTWPETSGEGEIFKQWPLSLLTDDERAKVCETMCKRGDMPGDLSDFLDAFNLDGYQSPNPFNTIRGDIWEKMHDEELSNRMDKAEIVFKIYYILKKEFGIDLFERIYVSSEKSFQPKKLWLFEDGADGFEPFAIRNYVESKRRVKKVLDPRKHAAVDKGRQAEITRLLKDDLRKLRHPARMTAAVLRAYEQMYSKKPNVVSFEGLAFGRRNHLLPAMLKRSGLVNEIISLDVDYEDDKVSGGTDANGVRQVKIGGKGLNSEEFMDQFFHTVGNPDVFILDDGLQHLPCPFHGADRAYEALTQGGKIEVISPFRFEGEESVLHTLWPMYRTPYRDSLLTLEEQEIWINWLIMKGGKVEFARMVWGTYSPDKLNRILMIIERPLGDETVLTPWIIPHDEQFDMGKSACEQGIDFMNLWPYDGLRPEEKVRVRAIVGDLNSMPLSRVRDEIAFKLVYEILEGEEKAEFSADKDGFIAGLLEGHDEYGLLQNFERRFGIDENLRQRFRNSSCMSLTCLMLKEFYGVDLADYVERDLQWQSRKYWRFSDNCPEYEEMHGVVEDSKMLMQMFFNGKE